MANGKRVKEKGDGNVQGQSQDFNRADVNNKESQGLNLSNFGLFLTIFDIKRNFGHNFYFIMISV